MSCMCVRERVCECVRLYARVHACNTVSEAPSNDLLCLRGSGILLKGTRGTKGTEGTEGTKETEGTKRTGGTSGTEGLETLEGLRSLRGLEGLEGLIELRGLGD